jgi:glycosyltransferase involved in cell wall biosynthesis
VLSIVIPVLNEGESLAELHRELMSVLPGTGREFEIVFVDDGSRDDTLARLRTLKPVRVLSFARNFGKSQALMAGFAAAKGDVIITMDGDLQDDPTNIPAFLEALDRGADLVCGWKQSRRDTWARRFVSRIANGVTAAATGVRVHDMNCCFKAYRAPVAKDLRLFGDQHRYIPALAAQQGFLVGEIPISHRPRKHGRSRYGPGRLINGLFDFITLVFLRRFTDRPMYLFGLIGMTLLAVGFGILAYLVGIKVFQGALIGDRPLLMLGVLLMLIGFQSFALGFLGELIIRQSPRGSVLYTLKETFQQ